MKKEISKCIDLQMSDNVKAVEIDENLNNIPDKNALPKIRAQFDLAEWL